MRYNKFTVGLTGGIGSGKTTVSHLFAKLGVPIIDTDVIARQITDKTGPGYTPIVKQFGMEILASTGEINRAKLREIVFSNSDQRLWLENLLHPLIHQTMVQQISTLQFNYCIAVIPLLIETRQQKDFDRVLVVDAPPALLMARAKRRDHDSPQSIAAIMAAQVSREDRCLAADDIILNDKDMLNLQGQVTQLHEKYMELSKV